MMDASILLNPRQLSTPKPQESGDMVSHITHNDNLKYYLAYLAKKGN